jgi:hypothetical protein
MPAYTTAYTTMRTPDWPLLTYQSCTPPTLLNKSIVSAIEKKILWKGYAEEFKN